MTDYELGSSTQRLIDEFEEGGNVPQGIAKVLRHLAGVYDVYDECLHGVRVSTLEDFADKLERRPKPPSLKEQALMALEDGDTASGASLTSAEVCIIRRALESIHD